jgi:protocatechuate 3,4-dioxygenase beta subunit
MSSGIRRFGRIQGTTAFLATLMGVLVLWGCEGDSNGSTDQSTAPQVVVVSGVVKNYKDGQPVEGAVVSIHEVNADGTLGAQLSDSPFYTTTDGIFIFETVPEGGYHAIWARSPVLSSPNQVHYYRRFDTDASNIELLIGSDPPTELAVSGSGYLEIRNECDVLFSPVDVIIVEGVCLGDDLMDDVTTGEDTLIVRENGGADGPGIKDAVVPSGTCEITVNGETYTVHVGHVCWEDGTPPFVATVLSIGDDSADGYPMVRVSGTVENFKDGNPVYGAVVSIHRVNADGTLGAQVGDSPFYTESDGVFTFTQAPKNSYMVIWARSSVLPSPNHVWYYRYYDADAAGIGLEIGSPPPTQMANAGSGYLKILNGSGSVFSATDTIFIPAVCSGVDLMDAITAGESFLEVREKGGADGPGIKDDAVAVGTHQVTVNGMIYTVYINPVNWGDSTPPFESTVLWVP